MAEAHALSSQELNTPQYERLVGLLDTLVHCQGLVPKALNDEHGHTWLFAT